LKKQKKSSVSDRPAPGRSFRITFGQVLLVMSGMVLMALLQVAWQNWMPPARAEKVPGNARGMVASTNATARWGKIQYVPVALDRPEEYFQQELPARQRTQWVFEGMSEGQLAALFSSLGLAGEAKSFLENRANWRVSSAGIHILPPPAVVLALSSPARGKLYRELARWPANTPYRLPFLFRAGGFDEWFDSCGLPPAKIEVVRQLTYSRGGSLCFADAVAFSEMASAEETRCLVRGLWRVSTFQMSVQLDGMTSVETLMGYWGRVGRARSYRPFVESLAREESGAIDVSFFMPAFARLRLYTYPRPDNANAIREDCFWTAMNFRNEEPDNRFFDPNETQRALRTEYDRIDAGGREFGDVLLLLGPGNEALHMCVFIADDVVFTKNGFNALQPWVLMKLEEMLGSYENERPFQIVTYRPRVTTTVVRR
jgi:hypothetical protein